MSKKLEILLEKEVKRFNQILSYQDRLSLNEVSYRFYNEADENQPQDQDAEVGDSELTAAMADITAGAEASDQQATDAGADMNTQQEPDMAEPAPETGAEQPEMGDQVTPTDDMGADIAEPEEDTTEIDVTDIVNNTNDIKTKFNDLESKLGKIDDIINKVKNIESNLTQMDNLINKMEYLGKQVELMRPPTEAERRKALANDSYPYNVTIDQYNSGQAVKNQTELERASKESMFDKIMHDYNENNIQNTFNVPSTNPLDRL